MRLGRHVEELPERTHQVQFDMRSPLLLRVLRHIAEYLISPLQRGRLHPTGSLDAMDPLLIPHNSDSRSSFLGWVHLSTPCRHCCFEMALRCSSGSSMHRERGFYSKCRVFSITEWAHTVDIKRRTTHHHIKLTSAIFTSRLGPFHAYWP